MLARAAARYLGDFCADDPYADWAAGPRELARHTFVETARQLGRLADDSGEHSEALRHRLRILDVDPYDETAHLDLIRALRPSAATARPAGPTGRTASPARRARRRPGAVPG